MKVSVSLRDEDVRYLDAYAQVQGLDSRSAALRRAVAVSALIISGSCCVLWTATAPLLCAEKSSRMIGSMQSFRLQLQCVTEKLYTISGCEMHQPGGSARSGTDGQRPGPQR